MPTKFNGMHLLVALSIKFCMHERPHLWVHRFQNSTETRSNSTHKYFSHSLSSLDMYVYTRNEKKMKRKPLLGHKHVEGVVAEELYTLDDVFCVTSFVSGRFLHIGRKTWSIPLIPPALMKW